MSRRILTALAFFFLMFVSLSAYALRIVSLKPNITKTLISLGQADQIVGITKFCPKPNPTAEIIADYTAIQTEAIVRLKPDVVLSSLENSESRQYKALEASGIRIELLNFETLDDFFVSLAKLDLILKTNPALGNITAHALRMRLQNLKTRATTLAKKTFTVIVQRQPLMVAAGHTYISTLFESVGLKNAFGDNQIAYPVLDEEIFIRQGVDFVFDMSHGAEWGKEFFGHAVIPIQIEDFLATPESVNALEKLMQEHFKIQTPPLNLVP
jgi:ABC-type Fe3+-hydroxamate transport system substrate-binding protein